MKTFSVIVICCLLLFSCTRKEERSAAPLNQPQSVAVNKEAMKSLGYVSGDREQQEPKKPSAMPRKIIKNGELILVVKQYEPFFRSLEKQLKSCGGYIAQIHVGRSGEDVSSATIAVRVPPEKMDLLVSWLREQGILTSEKINAEDVSESYYDLQARLANARKFEQRLLEMLQNRTGALDEVLQVEQKLSEIREQIEQFEGKIRYFDNLTEMATLSMQVSVEAHYVPPTPPGFGERSLRVWKESIGALVSFVQASALVVIALIPWLLPMAILAVLFWKLLRNRRKLVTATAAK